MISSSARPSSSSQTRNGWPDSSPDSWTAQTCGWVTSDAIRASRRKQSTRARPGHFLGPQQLDGDLAIEPQVARADKSRWRRRGRSAAGARSGRCARAIRRCHAVRRLTGFTSRRRPSRLQRPVFRTGSEEGSEVGVGILPDREQRRRRPRRRRSASPAPALARARPRCASGTIGDIGSTPRCCRISSILADRFGVRAASARYASPRR